MTISRTRRITIAGLVTAGLATGGVFGAQAAFASGGSSSGGASGGSSGSSSNAPKPPAAPAAPNGNDFDGTVTSASSSSLAVRDLFGHSRTYTLSSSTSVHDGPTKASVSSLHSGEHVLVHGTKSGSAYKATGVDVHPAHIGGSVVSVSGNTVTVTDQDGFQRTIDLSSSTKYTKDGKSSSRSAVTSGAVVDAQGSVDSDHTSLDATTVNVLTHQPTPPAGGPGAMGAPGGPKGAPAPAGRGTSGKSGSAKAPTPPNATSGKSGSVKAPTPPKGSKASLPAPSGSSSTR